MRKNTLLLAAACSLLGTLAGCGSQDKAAEDTSTVTTTEATATAPAQQTPAAPTAPASAPPASGTTATFDINSVPLSTADLGTFPYVGGMKGYSVNSSSDSVDYEFDRSYLYDGKNLLAVEGHALRREFNPKDRDKQASELMIRRNYENWVKSVGGTKVFSGVIPSDAVKAAGGEEITHKGGLSNYTNAEYDVYLIRQKDKEVWVQLQKPSTQYYLNMVERAAMPQQVSTVKAADIKKN